MVTLDKTKLKSNHYWVMVLLNKLTKLRVIKFEGNQTVSIGPDFFKFLVKGINYVAKEGRQIEKFQMNGILGYNNNDDNLYPFLKPNTNLVSIDVSKSKLTKEDARALGKVLADFRQVRELNLNNSGLSTAQTKEIADGLMRAKQLEVLKLANNPNMSTALENVIYNLAFSPKIRHIDLQDSKAGNSNVAEAIYKLIKISGAIEHLNLCNTGLQALLTAEFYKALGENKTLKYLNLACTSSVSSS